LKIQEKQPTIKVFHIGAEKEKRWAGKGKGRGREGEGRSRES